LLVGFFDPATGARLAAFDSGGAQLADDIFSVEFWAPP
jgi:hypothetical protein